VNGKVENQLFHGPLVSKWRMSTFEHREGFRYWTPLPTLLGKLGEPGGPGFGEYLFARKARESFRQSGLLLKRVAVDRAAVRPAGTTPERRQAGTHNRPAAAVCAAA
jgi:hypothetical protein